MQVAQQSGQFGIATGTAGGDFEQFLAGFAGKQNKNCAISTICYYLLDKSSYAQGKGSRFQHTEKLQFTEVMVTLLSHIVM